MFIRFSADEDINEYTIEATNTAGTQRLQDGTKIMGALVAKENILVWTDNALYTMKFVGAPFTFGFEQVGTNCGLIGQNAAIEIDGVAYWMSNNGFFSFDGTVNSLPCSVEDDVYDNIDTTKGQQICAGINNLFTEVFGGIQHRELRLMIDLLFITMVQKHHQVKWVTGIIIQILILIEQLGLILLFILNLMQQLTTVLGTGTFPAIVGETGLGQSVLFEHEIGTDQVNPDGTTTALLSFIQSYNFALQKDQGIGEYFLAMRRFLPNFKVLTGNNQVTISVLIIHQKM